MNKLQQAQSAVSLVVQSHEATPVGYMVPSFTVCASESVARESARKQVGGIFKASTPNGMRYFSGNSVYKFSDWNAHDGELSLELIDTPDDLPLSKDSLAA